MSEQSGGGHGPADNLDPLAHRRAVRERYAAIAAGDLSTCCESTDDADRARQLGYDREDHDDVGDGANLGLGCGNPTAIAGLTAGETVLDLGSGAGFDCFIAAQAVGETGHVIGVDMTPEMVEKARTNADDQDLSHVEFRLGEIEHLPIADETVDVIISNCVINLSPAKPQVFREAHRVLRPGGRLAVSDVVLTADLPPDLATDPTAVAACIGSAVPIADLRDTIRGAGFANVSIDPKDNSTEFIREWDDDRDLSEYVVSAVIEAEKLAT